MNAFSTVVIDVDSTLCDVEGIDWLARRRGQAVAAEVAELTRQAMDGAIALDAVYGLRLSLVAPTRNDVAHLGEEYGKRIAPGAIEAIAEMKRRGIDVHLVSGGLLPAVRAIGALAGIEERNVHAVAIHFDESGGYSSFDSGSPLTRHRGKADVIASLGLKPPSLIVGDGITDAEAKGAATAFAAFTGFVRRETAVSLADYVVTTFADVFSLVTR